MIVTKFVCVFLGDRVARSHGLQIKTCYFSPKNGQRIGNNDTVATTCDILFHKLAMYFNQQSICPGIGLFDLTALVLGQDLFFAACNKHSGSANVNNSFNIWLELWAKHICVRFVNFQFAAALFSANWAHTYGYSRRKNSPGPETPDVHGIHAHEHASTGGSRPEFQMADINIEEYLSVYIYTVAKSRFWMLMSSHRTAHEILQPHKKRQSFIIGSSGTVIF